jgi:putative transposase
MAEGVWAMAGKGIDARHEMNVSRARSPMKVADAIRDPRWQRPLIAGPRHLSAVLDEYAAHYSRYRSHRTRNLRPPDCGDIILTGIAELAAARIRRRRVLGRLVNEYQRAA